MYSPPEALGSEPICIGGVKTPASASKVVPRVTAVLLVEVEVELVLVLVVVLVLVLELLDVALELWLLVVTPPDSVSINISSSYTVHEPPPM